MSDSTGNNTNVKKPNPAPLIFFLVAIVVLIIIIFATCSSGGGDSGESENTRKARAYTYAQIAVKDNLTSPGTAKFPSITEAIITSEGDTYTIKAHVDAQNALGATVRENFLVVVELTGKDQYRIISVEFY